MKTENFSPLLLMSLTHSGLISLCIQICDLIFSRQFYWLYTAYFPHSQGKIFSNMSQVSPAQWGLPVNPSWNWIPSFFYSTPFFPVVLTIFSVYMIYWFFYGLVCLLLPQNANSIMWQEGFYSVLVTDISQTFRAMPDE